MVRVFVIDDDAGVRALIRGILEQAGYEVDQAENGKAGMNLYDRRHADIVVTDIFLPGYDGVETIIGLRRANLDVKIIAISGGGSSGAMGYLSYASKFGAQYVLAKPIREAHLFDALRHLLSEN